MHDILLGFEYSGLEISNVGALSSLMLLWDTVSLAHYAHRDLADVSVPVSRVALHCISTSNYCERAPRLTHRGAGLLAFIHASSQNDRTAAGLLNASFVRTDFHLASSKMAYDEYYRGAPSATQPSGGSSQYISNSYDGGRTRQDSFSGRFGGAGGGGASSSSSSNYNPAQQHHHPAALQSGSAMYLPPSTQLREDRVNSLSNTGNASAFRAGGSADVDDTNTITPFDSISNVDAGDNDASTSAMYYGGDDYLARDPYARDHQHNQQQQAAYSKSYNTRPRSGSGGGDAYDPRDSNGSLPLMQNAVHPATGRVSSNYYNYPDSIIDGDTTIEAKKNKKGYYSTRSLNPDEVERGILHNGSYPPPPRYDTPESDEKNDPFNDRHTEEGSNKRDTLVSTLKGRNKSGKRPNAWLRQLRDTTPLEEKIKNHKAGVGVQDRPWACWVIAIVLIVVFIVELVKSVSPLLLTLCSQIASMASSIRLAAVC